MTTLPRWHPPVGSLRRVFAGNHRGGGNECRVTLVRAPLSPIIMVINLMNRVPGDITGEEGAPAKRRRYGGL